MAPVKIKTEITPHHLRCAFGSCPGVYELEDGNLLIIGKKTSDSLHKEIKNKIGSDEFAVVINPDFFQNLSKSVK